MESSGGSNDSQARKSTQRSEIIQANFLIADYLKPNHQFGFRGHHVIIGQVHRITNTIENTLEKKICPTLFLDLVKTFYKVWHQGLMSSKLNKQLPKLFNDLAYF